MKSWSVLVCVALAAPTFFMSACADGDETSSVTTIQSAIVGPAIQHFEERGKRQRTSVAKSPTTGLSGPYGSSLPQLQQLVEPPPEATPIEGCVELPDGTCGVDISNWGIIQHHDYRTRWLATPTIVPAGSYLIITRGATREEFENFWHIELGPMDWFHSTNGVFPVLDGHETFTLYDEAMNLIDGPSPGFVDGTNSTRTDEGWVASDNPFDASPGTGTLTSQFAMVSEVGDVPAGANQNLAFIEIYVGNPLVQPPPPPSTCDTNADCAGHPDGPVCHPFGHHCGVDISNYGVIQSNKPASRYFSSPTVIRRGWTVIMVRNATQAEFEAYWSVDLPDTVAFVSNNGHFPSIDGDETYLIQAPGFVTSDGPSVAMAEGDVITRNANGSWSSTAPTPGSCDYQPDALVVCEVADMADPGYGNFEYVELYVGWSE